MLNELNMNSKYFLLVMFFVTTNACGDFYWRDYNGSIPLDAIPAGKNSNGSSYIGQAYIHDYGLLLGTIIPGQLEISVPCWGVRIIDKIIKILCAKDTSKFYWIPTISRSYQEDTKGKCPVLGGYDQHVNGRLGTLHVGRTRLHGDVIIGNIAVYDPHHPWFYYPLNGSEDRTSKFEVLAVNGDYVKKE